jgi:hypothetical protein
MNANIEKLQAELHDKLLPLQEIQNPRERLKETIRVIGPAIATLEKDIEQRTFYTSEEEIEVFKNTLPEFLALRIKEGLIYKIEINKPISTTGLQIKYYQEELKVMQSFFRLNTFHYQYYKNGFTELDNYFFLKEIGSASNPLIEISDTDLYTSTPISYLFAKFIAYENVLHHVLTKITALKSPEISFSQNKNAQEVDIVWTGDVTNLVELAYGIYLTGQLNHGNASLNQIVRWMEAQLHVTIGIIQKRFGEIERRKRLSPTKYIDQMKDNILRKIDKNTN